MDYKDNAAFLTSVKENNIFKIKSNLEGLIPAFKGDRIKCDEAIEYARKNSSFDWEIDDGVNFGEDLTTIEDRYNYEKGRLVQNFTKERYEKVLKLYKEYIITLNKNENIKVNENSNTVKEEKKEESTPKSYNRKKVVKKKYSQEDDDLIKKRIIVGLVILVIIYLLLKIIF